MYQLHKVLLAVVTTVFLSNATAQDSEAALDPEAMKALKQMGTYLRTLKAFRVKAETTEEIVLQDGQKLQDEGSVDLLARIPDGLRIYDVTDYRERLYLFNGKNNSFTLWSERMNYYSTVEAPGTIDFFVTGLEEKNGISIPLLDLFRWGTDSGGIAAIKSALNVGPAVISGTTCQHYAFRQDEFDWQLWVQLGDYPLPCKLVVTSRQDESRPQSSTVYHWDLAPSFNDVAFDFVVPEGVQRIVLGTAQPTNTPKQ